MEEQQKDILRYHELMSDVEEELDNLKLIGHFWITSRYIPELETLLKDILKITGTYPVESNEEKIEELKLMIGEWIKLFGMEKLAVMIEQVLKITRNEEDKEMRIIVNYNPQKMIHVRGYKATY